MLKERRVAILATLITALETLKWPRITMNAILKSVKKWPTSWVKEAHMEILATSIIVLEISKRP